MLNQATVYLHPLRILPASVSFLITSLLDYILLMATKKIAIIGAGPAGCTLARLLQASDAPVEITIYESDGSLTARTQGGTLDLHTDTGIAALKKANLYDEFLKHARFDGEALVVVDRHLRWFLKIKGSTENAPGTGRPEIDRYQLRRILLESLLPDTVKWNCRLRKIEEVEGKVLLHFDHGVESGFDLVIGADGAWSKVRSLLTDVKPEHYGLGGFRWVLPDAAEKYPILSKLVNRGSVFSFSDGKAITAQQLGTGGISCSAWFRQPEHWENNTEYDLHDAGAIQSKLLKVFADWNPILRGFIDEMTISEVDPTSLYMLPIGTDWKHKPGITLIGDAAHLFTPFAGEGVNMAMKDAVDLAETIVKSLLDDADDISAGIPQFESQMLKRNTKVQQTSYDMMRAVLFEQGAGGIAFNIQKWVSSAVGDEINPILGFIFRRLVSTFYFFFRLFGLGTGLQKSLES